MVTSVGDVTAPAGTWTPENFVSVATVVFSPGCTISTAPSGVSDPSGIAGAVNPTRQYSPLITFTSFVCVALDCPPRSSPFW